MTEALTRKLLACQQRIARVRAALPARAEQVLDDERLEAFLSFHIFLLLKTQRISQRIWSPDEDSASPRPSARPSTCSPQLV